MTSTVVAVGILLRCRTARVPDPPGTQATRPATTEPAHKGLAKTRRGRATERGGWQRLAKVLAMGLAKVLVAACGLRELGNIVSEGEAHGVAHGVAVVLQVDWQQVGYI